MTDFYPWSLHPSVPWAHVDLPIRFVVIKEGMTSVGAWAFMGYRRLITVSLPSTVTFIGQHAFHDCYRLRSAPLPPNLTTIEEFAFYGCKRLENVTLPPKLSELGSGAFSGCAMIRSIDIPPTLNTISASAFEGCGNLTNLTIPDSVTAINEWAFKGCVNLTKVRIPSSVGTLASGAFAKCSSLTAFEGSSVMYDTEDGVIFYRRGMGLVQYPAGKKGNYTIKSNVQSIAEYAFSGCDGLTHLVIESEITTIPDHAFEDCANLKSVTYASPPQSIGESAFSGCRSLEVAPIVPGISSIGMDAFSGCSSLKSVTIPPSISSIEYSYRAFSGCTSLETAILNPSSDTIPSSFFLGCSSLKSVTFSDNIIRISGNAFEGCSSLNTISLPSRIQYIGYRSFAGCSSVTSVDIPSTILGISQGAFSNCSKLESITVKGTNTSYTSNDGVLFSGKTLLQYPCGKGDNYVIPSSVEILADQSFSGCAGLTTLSIPPAVNTIKSDCFEESGLKSMTIPATVKKLGDRIFRGCVDLESVTVKTSFTSTPIQFFDGCSSLKYVSLPSSLTSLTSFTFRGCRSLSNLTIPSVLTSVFNGAFEGCESLTFIKYEGKSDPCAPKSSSDSYDSGRFSTCTSLDIVCVPLDYVDSMFCEMPICKTTHCEQEMSKYNQCYELVKCGEPDAEVRLRANASEWIQQTDGCVEYICNNRTGRVSWSNCNSSDCVQGTCATPYAAAGTEEYEVLFDVDMPVDDWNMTNTTNTVISIGTVDIRNETKVGVAINGQGGVVRVLMLTTDFESAELVSDVAKHCARDPESPVTYDDMCDEFNCTGFMHVIKRVTVTRLPNVDQLELDVSAPRFNHVNQLLLIVILLATAFYLL